MILGHERQIDYFRRALKRGTLAHAYLLYGPEQVGKFTLVQAVAQALWCEKKKILNETCGQCSACQAIEKNIHPRVIVLSPERAIVEEKKEKRKEIAIGDIRELRRQFSFALPAGEWRVALIDRAEKMSQEAANALLKLLEEPGERTLFFLITAHKELLLPTIVSRTQSIRFSPLPQDLLLQLLNPRERAGEMAKEMLWYAAGRPGIISNLINEAEKLEHERVFAKAFLAALRGGIPESFRFSEKHAEDEAARKKTYGYIMRYLRDQLHKTAAAGNTAVAERIKKVERIATLLETTNVNARLALDVMFLEALGS